jgi:uncharacterized protein YdaU (DUF1376 family)
MNYYERHLGDYAKDTAHLTMLEHGAYNLLLDRYYGTEKGIPADQVYRVARARSKDERAAVDTVLNEFFDLSGGLWIKNRCAEEIAKAQAKIDASRLNGKKGGRPKNNPTGTQEEPTGFHLGSENGTQTITQTKALQSPISSLHSEVDKSTSGDSAPSVDQAIYSDARKVFGKSIGGQIGKAIKSHGRPWIVGVIEACRSKDPEQARAYLAAAMNGVAKPSEAEQRRVIP